MCVIEVFPGQEGWNVRIEKEPPLACFPTRDQAEASPSSSSAGIELDGDPIHTLGLAEIAGAMVVHRLSDYIYCSHIARSS